MPTDLLAKTLARLLTLYIQLQYYRVVGSSGLLKTTSTQLELHVFEALGLLNVETIVA